LVSPSFELLDRIKNTEHLINTNQLQLLSEKVKLYPKEYIDITTYNKLNQIKPWIEHPKPVSITALADLPIRDNILIICVDFIDKPAQRTTSDIYTRFFSSTGKTFRNYYSENSYSKYIPEGNVHGWYRAPQLSTYYTDAEYGLGAYPNNTQRLVEDIIEIISQDPAINWSYIDNDGDNYIDYLLIVHSGAEAASSGNTGDFWAHVSRITPRTRNGYTFEYYALCAEYISYPSETPVIGVDCHEFGHILGLPDLYDYSKTSYGIGIFSLMSHGSWANEGMTPTHFDAWCKFYLGYITLIDNITGYISLNTIETNNIAIRYYNISNTTEQFIIENRQNILFDTYLPGNGLLIWKINYSKYTNDDKTCFKVGLVQADGQHHLENMLNYGDSGDFYPGTTLNRTLNQTSIPNTILCNGTTRDLNIYNISNSASTMTFSVSVTCITPTCTLQLS